MSEPMDKVELLASVLERMGRRYRTHLSGEEQDALRSAVAILRDTPLAKVVAATNAATARALEVVHRRAIGGANAITEPHLYVGPSGGTCYLCPHPKDHDIHQNRGAP